MMQSRIAAVVGLTISGLSAQGWAASDLPLSVTEIPLSFNQSLNQRAARAAQEVQPEASFAHPELLGAIAIGAYFVYKGRIRRVI